MPDLALVIVGAVVVLLIVVLAAKAIRIVPQATARTVERFGRYHRTLNAGMHLVAPFVDRLRAPIDLREQVVSFPPQPVITRDNVVVGINTVTYFQVTDALAATYEVVNYTTAIEQLTVTTLRKIVSDLDLEDVLTSRDRINSVLQGELDNTTGRWGIRVLRVELNAIEPPASIRDSMEKLMRAERDKRAAILGAEGSKQATILTAEGERQATVIIAHGETEATVLRGEAEAKAQAARSRGQAETIATVFRAIRDSNPDSMLVDILQTLPPIWHTNGTSKSAMAGEETSVIKKLSSTLDALTSSQRTSVVRQRGVELPRAGAPPGPDFEEEDTDTDENTSADVGYRAISQPTQGGG